jgi:hypothetical protein
MGHERAEEYGAYTLLPKSGTVLTYTLTLSGKPEAEAYEPFSEYRLRMMVK